MKSKSRLTEQQQKKWKERKILRNLQNLPIYRYYPLVLVSASEQSHSLEPMWAFCTNHWHSEVCGFIYTTEEHPRGPPSGLGTGEVLKVLAMICESCYSVN